MHRGRSRALGIAAPILVYPILVMKVLCFALFACAFNLLIGYTGLLSFGHAAFLGAAGYVAGHAIKVWEFPQEGAKYVIGGDPAHGNGGEADYAVASVIRIPSSGPDIQVAVFRSNTTDPLDQARIWNYLGRHYNDALLAVEANKLDMVASDLRTKWNYPNLYRERNRSTGAPTGRFCWITDEKSKPAIYLHMKRWLKMHLFEPRSRNFAEEMKFFRKDDDETTSAEGKRFKDDELMATMISVFVAHSDDWDEALGMIRRKQEMTLDNSQWHLSCSSCAGNWPSNDVSKERNCPHCHSLHIVAKPNPRWEKPRQEPGEADPIAELNQMLKEYNEQLQGEADALDYNML